MPTVIELNYLEFETTVYAYSYFSSFHGKVSSALVEMVQSMLQGLCGSYGVICGVTGWLPCGSHNSHIDSIIAMQSP